MARRLAQLGLRVGGAGPRAAPGGARRWPRRWAARSRPVRFVNSLGLGDPPSAAGIARRVERYPTVGFKLDAGASWTRGDRGGARGAAAACETVDFKGRYGLEVADEDALVAMYRAVLDAFPYALLEDPHELPAVEALIAPVRDRVSLDAPIRTPADIGATRTINVKPSRIGGLRPLFDDLRVLRRRTACAMYGGGMGELGVGRGQIELLAALFHPDAPNDVAPSAFNAPELAGGLPSSPLGAWTGPWVPGFRAGGSTQATSGSRVQRERALRRGLRRGHAAACQRVGLRGGLEQQLAPALGSPRSSTSSPRRRQRAGRAGARADPRVLGDRAAQAQLGLVGAARACARQPRDEVLRGADADAAAGDHREQPRVRREPSRAASAAASRSPSSRDRLGDIARRVPVDPVGQVGAAVARQLGAALARALARSAADGVGVGDVGQPGPRLGRVGGLLGEPVAVDLGGAGRGPRACTRAATRTSHGAIRSPAWAASASASRPSASASAQRPSSCASAARQSGTYQR